VKASWARNFGTSNTQIRYLKLYESVEGHICSFLRILEYSHNTVKDSLDV